MERYTATKGDFGYRIYDRKRKRYLKTKSGLIAWYNSKENAQNKAKALNN